MSVIFNISIALSGFVLQSHDVKIKEITKEPSLYVRLHNGMQLPFAKYFFFAFRKLEGYFNVCLSDHFFIIY